MSIPPFNWISGDPDQAPADPGWVNLRVEIETDRGGLRGTLTAANSSAALSDLVPAANAMCDDLVQDVMEHLSQSGTPVTCQAGCSACCEMYVIPLSVAETGYFWNRVQQLPEARWKAVLGKFIRSMESLLAAPPPPAQQDEAKSIEAFAEWYSSLCVPCPLLKDHLCEVYEHRPLACREHMVTCAAALCRAHQGDMGKAVGLPVSVAETLYALSAEMEETQDAESIVLTMLPSWLDMNEQRLRKTWPAPLLARKFVRNLHQNAGVTRPSVSAEQIPSDG
jgi:Fe-S-cluster containining protein